MSLVGERFGANLKRVRKARGLSQEQVSVRAELHRTEVGMLERGVRLPRIDTFVKLVGAIGATPDELLRGLDWTPPDTVAGSFGEEEGDR